MNRQESIPHDLSIADIERLTGYRASAVWFENSWICVQLGNIRWKIRNWGNR